VIPVSRFPGATWTSSHVYGDILLNHKQKLFYVNIPKCASSWMKRYLELLGENGKDTEDNWNSGNFATDPVDEYQPVIILRDPVERCLSMCPGLRRMHEEQFVKELPQVLDNFSTFMQDEHSALQTDFIQGIDLSHAVFFYCDDNLSNNVRHFLESKQIYIDPPAPLNTQPKNELFDRGVKVWQSIFANTEYLARFKKNYINDYNLINQVTFYDAR